MELNRLEGIPLSLLAFQHHLGSLFISPHDLTFSREIGLGETVLVEQGYTAAGSSSYASEMTKVECAIKSFRNSAVALSPEHITATIKEAKILRTLSHR